VIHRQIGRGSVITQERGEHGRIGDHKDAAGIKEHSVNFMISDDESSHPTKGRRTDR